MPRLPFRRLLIGLLTLVGVVSPPAGAQPPRRQPTPNDRLASPELHPDRTVTFRIYAPKASEVTVRGDFADGPPAKLTKGDDGVWAATVGPLRPDCYSYAFSVDGVRTIDPKNPTFKPGIASLDSMFFLPGLEAEFMANQRVPHGQVRQVWYASYTLGEQRRMHVYTPPGYEQSSGKFPVFYLLHGGGDDDSGWSTIGRANFILDNLIAAGKSKPMLVVMPNGSLPRPASRAPGEPAVPATRQALQDRFTSELLKDVIPHVEKHFRVATGSENRALAGLSMGGAQSMRVLTTHPDQFAYVGIWSAGLFGTRPADYENQTEDFFKNAEQVNRSVKLLEVTVGEKDFALPGSKALDELFQKHGIKHEFRQTGGGHTWINWRQYLNELAPKLFR